jgi:hypothetical protein
MRVELPADAAHEFMAIELAVERNGMKLTMGSALARLGIDPWAVAGELAAASRADAVARLTALLDRVPASILDTEIIARRAVAALPSPSVEAVDWRVVLRLAARNHELMGGLLCFAVTLALAILMTAAVANRDPNILVAGYGLAVLAWISPWLRSSRALRLLLAIASAAIGGVFATVASVA